MSARVVVDLVSRLLSASRLPPIRDVVGSMARSLAWVPGSRIVLVLHDGREVEVERT